MNIIELAIKHGDYSVEHGINGVQFTNKELQAFAQAVIENYKASLVPVAWLWIKEGQNVNAFLHRPTIDSTDSYWLKKGFSTEPLYALPSGETK